jgi:hypothetical protein
MTRNRSGLGMLSGRGDEDPMLGVANLFDIGVVFALGFMVALLSAVRLMDVFNPESRVTMTIEREDGLEIVVRDGQTTTVRRMTQNVGSGDGTRLGVAYKLKDGTVVYVPEDE